VAEKTVSSNEIIMGQPVLPVILTNFSGRKLPNSNLLEWTTGTEINSQVFVVERGNDGMAFAEIGRVVAAGNSNTLRNYNLTDAKFEAGKNFYRLKMIDLDGSFRYSRVVLIDNSKESLITSLSPNPGRTGTESLLSLTGLQRGKVGISILSGSGAAIKNMDMMSADGNLQVRLNATQFASGTYMIVIRNADGTVAETVKWSVIR
jgi:hypothetical protein